MKYLITLLGALAAVSNLLAQSKISVDLQNAPANPAAKVIVQFNRPPGQTQLNAVSLLGGLLGLDLNLGLVNTLAYTLSSSAIATLANNPDVKYISPDRSLTGSLEFANPTVNANLAFNAGYTGSGGLLGALLGSSTVAIIDSGVTDHPDLHGLLLSRLLYSQSFVPGSSSTADAYGHGTHVAGIVAGNASQSSGNSLHTFRGIAPGAGIVNLRALDANGSGSDSTVIAAIGRAIALKSQYNIRVINLSLGRPVYESYLLDPLCQAVEQAWKAGIVVVVAAGNEGRNNTAGTHGYGTITSPGNDPYVITVGAMKDMLTANRGDDQIASYSSKGPSLIDHVVKPDLLAPGNRIVSLAVRRAPSKTRRRCRPGSALVLSKIQPEYPF